MADSRFYNSFLSKRFEDFGVTKEKIEKEVESIVTKMESKLELTPEEKKFINVYMGNYYPIKA